MPNEIIKSEMDAIHAKLLNTLKMYLHNSAITLAIRVAEQGGKEKILTRREQFELLTHDNPAIEKLREVFDLELA